MSNTAMFFIIVGISYCVDKLWVIEDWIEGGTSGTGDGNAGRPAGRDSKGRKKP